MSTLPAPVVAYPLISDWIRFEPDGTLRVRTGRVELGQGIATAMVQIAADALSVAPERVRLVSGDTREAPDEGVTAGSLSVSVGGVSLRFAALAARARLLERAAALLQSSTDALDIVDGEVRRSGMASDLTLWRLAEEVDLAVAITTDVPPVPHTLAPLPRADLLSRIAGGFIHDMRLPGMLHGRPVHPPALHARLLSVDVDALAARPGVAKVVRDGDFLGVLAEREDDALAAVAWATANAVWSDGPAESLDPVAHLAAADGEAEVVLLKGEPPAEGTRFSVEVSRPPLSHGSIGPSCAIAQWSEERLTVHCHSQAVYRLKAALAEVLGLDPATVDVIHRNGAGCYGHNGADDVALDAALLARAVPGRPVRVVWSRADEFGTAPVGAPMVTRATAIVANGRIEGFEATATSFTHSSRPGPGAPYLRSAYLIEDGVPIETPGDIPLAAGGGAERNAIPAYAIAYQRVAKRVVGDIPVRTSAMRGLGAFLNVTAIETLVDDVARALGEDPVAFRLAHLDDPRARAVVEAAADGAGWPGTSADGAAYGIGYARYKNRAGYCAVVARIEVEEDVRVTDAWAAVDVGEAINPDGVRNQIEGGIVQSTSWALKEAVRYEGDRVATRDWETYPILTFPEVPRITVRIVGPQDAPPLGCGEAAQGPTAAAISNALAEALGVRLTAMPFSREAIVAALSA
ncbi:xanthine dehydrogenase family protein molybdopterin-binding subunit [Acuticoccus mangrovi]|uniref:Xanthine dehydrogenase family protein molybdopterin-binding subunit n=1 Tax=Acuticoccus mangrovi TaxID=2796142 RepID=A0A934IIV0_9HYPH|nr:molybdopterin cofactor-binding domain-containing protein [Acuticoccus mangrovi]MBJ3775786.1 xanthine dehydrogenase family protein molybdopterin-binding subunit [Acuticoccus mangrovi]